MNLPAPRFLMPFLVLLLGLFLAGPAAAQLYDAPPPPGSAFLRVFNASTTPGLAGSVGDLKFADVGEYAASEFQFLPAASYTLAVGSQSQAVKLEEGHYYTAVLQNGAIRVIDQKGFDSRLKALVAMINLLDGTTLSLKTADGSKAVVEGVAAGTSGQREVNAVKVSLAVYDGDAKLAEPKPIALERGRAFGLFVAGTKEQPVLTWVVN